MINVSAVEIGVVAGAFLLFLCIPGLCVWVESARRRRAATAALRSVTVAEVVATPEAPQAAEVAAEVVAEPAAPIAADVSSAAAVVSAEAAVAPATEIVDEPTFAFRLDDLRHARVLEAPSREVLDDPARRQQWEEGLRLAGMHAAPIGAASLSASFEPQARCFAGMGESDGANELRFWLFHGLWPTSVEQAAAEAVFELGAEGIAKAYVVRRG